uniref:Uncharacterized protein n=1 Tax=Kalanchoe fedtschenkoi TaxID=63787 RepID=A0A7N1A6Z1_KALFE
MGGHGDQLRCFAICNWLYNLIMKTLAAQTLKTVTLGQPQPGADASQAPPATGAPEKENQPMEIDSNQKTFLPSLAGTDARTKAPKKSVSMAVEIVDYKKKTKLKTLFTRTRRRSLSMDHLGGIAGDRPVKSILKVGSCNSHARSTSFG